MPNVLKKYVILLFLLVVLILFSLNLGSLTSQTNSSYKTIINSNTSIATVAKWDIKALDKNGASVSMLGEGFKLEDTNAKGNWLFEVSNNSEVNAIINANSKIRVRIDSDNFKSQTISGLGWNFLKQNDIYLNNPIIFKVYIYDGGLNTVLTTNGTSEVIKEPGVNDKLLLTTSEIAKFETGSETIESEKITYYYYDIDLMAIKDTIDTMPINSKKTFRVEWYIDTNVNSGTGSGNEYIQTDGYKAYYQQIGNNDGLIDAISVNNGSTTYYIGYKSLSNYDYFNYICETGYGDEPSFIFPTSVMGSAIKVPYSKLTDGQINEIKNYPKTRNDILSGTNEAEINENIRKYIELKTYDQYGEFIKNQNSFISSLGYLEYGLNLRITFDIKVEQVD